MGVIVYIVFSTYVHFCLGYFEIIVEINVDLWCVFLAVFPVANSLFSFTVFKFLFCSMQWTRMGDARHFLNTC